MNRIALAIELRLCNVHTVACRVNPVVLPQRVFFIKIIRVCPVACRRTDWPEIVIGVTEFTFDAIRSAVTPIVSFVTLDHIGHCCIMHHFTN